MTHESVKWAGCVRHRSRIFMKTTKRKTKSSTRGAAAAEAAEQPQAKRVPMVALASHCTVKDAAALKSELCALADDDLPVTVDIGAVERVDTSTMQLLCAFVRDRAARDRQVVWRGESQGWSEAVRLLGCADMLGGAAAAGNAS